MEFNLSDHQRMYLETVRRFVKTEILPHILELDGKHAFPFEIIRKVWETGILNLSIPGDIKGYEMDAVSSALIIEELSYGDSGIATSAMCNDLANAVIAQNGAGPQQEAFLRPFVDNPLLASFCLTEPGAGSDNSAMTTFMSRREDGTYLLNGAKCFITNASYASQFTVFCKVGKPTGNFMACVIVPVASPSPAELAGGFEQG
jgi:acyl-CoA dehydrogenase